MQVLDAIQSRRAVRQFSADPVSREVITQVVDAGRRSASAKNRQPWQFIVVTERPTLQALSECGQWCTHLAGAAFAVALVVEDLHEPPTLTTPFDLGRASQNMILAAWSLGLGSVMATIYEAEKARQTLHVPAEMAVPWAISFGYPHPDADPRQRPPRKGMRRQFDEVVRWERW